MSFNYHLPWDTNTVKSFIENFIGYVFNKTGAYSAPTPQQTLTQIIAKLPAKTGTQSDEQRAAQVAKAFVAAGAHGSAQSFLPAFQEAGVPAPDILISCSVPDRFEINALTIQAYSGPLWNCITYFQSPPIGECFVYDAEAAPVLVYRVTPLKDENGYFVSPAEDPAILPLQLPHVFTDTSVITAQSTALSDNEVLNYFFVYSDIAATGGGSAAAYVTSSILQAENFSVYSGGGITTNPYWIAESARKFGLRPLNVMSPWVPIITLDGKFKQNALELAAFLGKVYGHNESLLSGTITAHGSEDFIPGRYLGLTDQNTTDLFSYYIEQVDEVFDFVGSPNPSWTATLGVTRGQKVSSFAPAK